MSSPAQEYSGYPHPPVHYPPHPGSEAEHGPAADSLSLHSNSPLQPRPSPSAIIPMPTAYPPARHVRLPDTPEMRHAPYDPERGKATPPSGASTPGGHIPRNSSWDLLAGIRRFENQYSEFDSRNASEAHLAFADGDIPQNKFAKAYHYLLNASVITRWTLFIVPILAILWIPGILSFTAVPNATVWGVNLRWWSIWLTVVWAGWWGSLLAARTLPFVTRSTVGIVAVGSRRYIEWLDVLNRYVSLFMWTLAMWVSFQPLIDDRIVSTATAKERNVISTIAKVLFGLFLCAAILVAEKFAIQWIAGKFHERSYAERIAAQKFAVKTLTTLYRNSRDIPGRSDTLRDGVHAKRASVNPRQFIKRAMKGVRFAATTTTTALGNVASEIAGSSVLQPNSPAAMVQTALESANKSRLLARRLFYSFSKPHAEVLLPEDIAPFFPNPEVADAAFAFFDKDGNGDASRDEVEMACMECHREQLSIEHSMQDLDSAVGRLDNILMTLYFFVCIIVVAVVLDTQLVTLITGAGTIILGLSWLVGSSLSEVLTSIIFLFIKHPYDVGDRVDLDGVSYTVKEIMLLSTVFLDAKGCSVYAPNTVINGKFIMNIRRSPQMSETFTFDVAFDTSFEHLENLRTTMIEWLQTERRDYLPSFDLYVVDIPEQTKMTLKADIKYKSNWQIGAIKAKRRNKWICMLKTKLAEVGIFGPGGNPGAKAAPAKYTLVPWDEVKQDEKQAEEHKPISVPEEMPSDGWKLTGGNAVIVDEGQDVFGEGDELNMTNPRRGKSATGSSATSRPTLQMPAAVTMPRMPSRTGTPRTGTPDDFIEMRSVRDAGQPWSS